MILHVHMLAYNCFLFEGLNWGKDFFARLPIPTAVYMTFFPNNETQILFSGFDDTPPILYHGLELTNVDLLSTLPWLNINNLKCKWQKLCALYSRSPAVWTYMWMWTRLLLSLDTKVWNVLFHDFYVHIVFVCCIVLNVVGLYLFYRCISFSLSGYRSY